MTSSASINSSLLIRDLELSVHLGWPDAERSQEQIVHLDVDIFFLQPPKACVTDNLDDTICYSTLIKHIRDHVMAKKFHLIEHLSHEIYHVVKAKLPDKAKINLRITKHPHIDGLTGGVCFGYDDGCR